MALTHLDAGVLIGFLDSGDAHHSGARAVLEEAVADGTDLALAASAMAECMVGPARRGEGEVRTFLDLCEQVPIRIVALDEEIATAAARLRAGHRSLRLPDALVIATAIVSKADTLVTTDREWPPNATGDHGLTLRVL